jgi:hypothetical protein
MAEKAKADPQLEVGPDDLAAGSEVEQLRARVRELEARTVQAPSGIIGGATEVYAGEVPLVDADGKEVDGETEPSYFYRIDLPPSGGQHIVINGVMFYHGEQYKVRVSTLRTMKEIVFRGWQHEASIRGSNENFYRAPQERRIGSRA